jgi:hypothetical protein
MAGDAMHEVTSRAISLIEFGFNAENLYLSVRGPEPMHAALAVGRELSLNFLSPAGLRVVIRLENGVARSDVIERTAAGPQRRQCPDVTAAVGRLAEVRIPFECLGRPSASKVAFIVAMHRGGSEVEHYPRHQPIEFTIPDNQFPRRNWRV